MYQALYRKWRPRTFDDVVGQDHITETLKRQVASGRLSHAYLFTGTRGTGKTTCAKILSRAVNCQNPVDGNPCNQCPACLGIENGSILDVLELDAASNNGVDQVRALRDEAVYTPAAVRKRVYIVDEVHMLSTPAFNALLKILEEPPEHLMFILATTELHKVPATIKSRCQQFSFKRILPGQIAQRLGYVAGQEGIDLTGEGAALLARLADGGMRDALSLLDQCAGAGQRVDEQEILDTLGLAGNLETAKLMGLIAAHDTAGALETLGRLYGNGKDVSSVLEELSSLARDLLLRKTAPQGGTALLTGGYDGNTMRSLGEQFTAPRLLQILKLLQSTLPELARSSSRRTDAELCLIRLCDERLDDSAAGLAARVARLEELLAGGIPASVVTPAPPAAPVPQPAAPVQSPPCAPRRSAQTGGPQRGRHAPLGGGAAAPAPRAGGGALLRPAGPAPGPAGGPSRPGGGCPACRPQSQRRGRGDLRLLARLRGRPGGEGAPLGPALPQQPGKSHRRLEERLPHPVGGQRVYPGHAQQAHRHPARGPGGRCLLRHGGDPCVRGSGAAPGGGGLRAPDCRGEARRFGRPAGLRGPVRQHQNSVIRPSAMPAGETAKKSRPPAHGGGRRKWKECCHMAKGFGSRGIPGMGGGMNMNMIKQAQKMQQDMLKMQQELEEKTYEASAGGGVVTASVSGKRELKSLTIDPDAVDPDDVEMLEDMIVAAVNEALRAAESDAASNMQKLTGGLGLPF